MKNTKKYEMQDDTLYRSILLIKDAQECYDFFVDLCTVAELAALEQRFEVARLLRQAQLQRDTGKNGRQQRDYKPRKQDPELRHGRV